MSAATITKADYIRAVEKKLYEYPFLLAAVETEKEFQTLYPSTTSTIDDIGGGRPNTISDTTGKIAVLRVEFSEKVLWIRAIERAMEKLSDVEKELVETKYFNTQQPSDEMVKEIMRLPNTSFHRIKEQALRKIAIALNII